MKKTLTLLVLFVVGGCAVHDDHPLAMSPAWWPTPVVKDSEIDGSGGPAAAAVNLGAPTDVNAPDGSGSSVSVLGSSAGPDARNGSALIPPPIETQDVGDRPPLLGQPGHSDLANVPQPTATPGAGSVSPTRGQAAQQANSPTLYPPRGSIQSDPSRNVTLYPRGPVAPQGFRGE